MADYNVSGWIKRPADARDYPMAAHLETVGPPTVKARRWQPGPNLDQGQTPDCVGFTGADFLGCEPFPQPVSNQTGFDLYAKCKQIDGSPNSDGSYDRALMKVLPHVGAYHWAASEPEIRDWILTTGPVCLGTVWHQKMFSPSALGKLSVSGPVVGGHEYLLIGYRAGWYELRNSWGASWGVGGNAYLSRAAVHRLVFVENGDACAAVKVA